MWKLLGLATAAVCRKVTVVSKPDWSRNTVDSIQWKFGVSNITKHLERVHSMKLKECGVFDCYNKASKVIQEVGRIGSPKQSYTQP